MSDVNLIALSKPSAITDCNTAAELIAFTARVSNPGNQSNKTTAPKLLRYLIKEKHWSPFEMVHMTMEIKTTRDIARQILRHRSFSFQEFSQRYAEPTEWRLKEARLQDLKNRQNSISTDDDELNQLAGRTVPELLTAAYQGTNQALQSAGRPVIDIELESTDAFSLGQFFQMMMLATVVEGRLLGINPYGQPGVEAYKNNMQSLLGIAKKKD